jgi:hypothetical protein
MQFARHVPLMHVWPDGHPLSFAHCGLFTSGTQYPFVHNCPATQGFISLHPTSHRPLTHTLPLPHSKLLLQPTTQSPPMQYIPIGQSAGTLQLHVANFGSQGSCPLELALLLLLLDVPPPPPPPPPLLLLLVSPLLLLLLWTVGSAGLQPLASQMHVCVFGSHAICESPGEQPM